MSDLIEEKLKAFASTTILHPAYEKSIKKILHSIYVSNIRGEASSTILLGDPGTGKTTLCEHLVNIIGTPISVSDEHGEYLNIPALFCSIPADCASKRLAMEILKGLCSTDGVHRNTVLVHRILTRLTTCKTKVIILDELQHLLSKGAEKTLENLCNWVKDLINTSHLPIILVGTPNCERIVDAHPQLARRYPFRARLKNLELNSEFQTVLTVLIGEMIRIGELQAEIFITDKATTKIFYAFSGGNFGALCVLLREIFQCALERSKNTLTRDDCVAGLDGLDLPPFLPLPGNAFTLPPQVINNLLSRHSP